VHELYLASTTATGLQASQLLCSNHTPSKATPIHRQLLGNRMHELLLAQTLTKFGESTKEIEEHAAQWTKLENAGSGKSHPGGQSQSARD